MADSQRLRAALHVGPASGMMNLHRLGALRFGSFFVEPPVILRPQAVQTYPRNAGSGFNNIRKEA